MSINEQALAVVAEHFAAVTGEPRAGRFERTMAKAAIEAYLAALTVTTVEELDALPVGSVVMDGDGYVGRKERAGSRESWAVSLHKFSKDSAAFSLPARVLHIGGTP